MSLRCKLGIHDWKITREEAGVTDILVEIEMQRTCQRCGKMQERDTHCLGLNPPEYIRMWKNIEPPKPRSKLPLFNDTCLFKEVADVIGKVEAMRELLQVYNHCKKFELAFVTSQSLDTAFDWSLSPQGYSYWRKVCMQVVWRD